MPENVVGKNHTVLSSYVSIDQHFMLLLELLLPLKTKVEFVRGTNRGTSSTNYILNGHTYNKLQVKVSITLFCRPKESEMFTRSVDQHAYSDSGHIQCVIKTSEIQKIIMYLYPTLVRPICKF